MSKIITNVQDLLIVFVTVTITLTICGILTFSIVTGTIALTSELTAILIGALSSNGLVIIVKFLFTKPNQPNEKNT